MLQLFTILIFLITSQTGRTAENVFNQDYEYAKKQISIDRVKSHITFLGSDFLQGRGTGSIGGELAAKYLAKEFSDLNLLPIAVNNTYYQYIPMLGSKAMPTSKLTVLLDDLEIGLVLNEDYLLYKSGEQTFLPVPTPMVFVGYGIIAPEFDYNDYHNIDVEGKIVVCIGGEPYSDNPKFFEADKRTIHSLPEMKHRNALSRGAKGFVYIPNFNSDIYTSWNRLQSSYLFDDVTLAYRASGNLGLIINPEMADLFFEGTKYRFDDIQKLHKLNRINSFDLNVKISFVGQFKERTFVASNIIGMIQGKNTSIKEPYIIISAHYDHLGIGPAISGDSIYNGVLDNAVGVAALLEIAKLFKSLPKAPQRSIIFILLTGEEKGLLGSTYYTDHPVVPLYKTAANINIDGLSFIDQVDSFIGIGKEYSDMEIIMENTAERFGLSIADIPPEFIQTESFLQSDQYAFANAGIPSILIVEGINYRNINREDGLEKLINYLSNIYHSPFDDLNQEINYKAIEQHISFIFSLCYQLAYTNVSIEWKSDSPYLKHRLRSRAEKR